MIYAVLAARWLVGVLILRGGTAKLMGGQQKRNDSVARYALVPGALVGPAAVTIAVSEAILGPLLVVGVQIRVAATLSALLLTAFSVAIILNLLRGRSFECGCGGSTTRTISWRLAAQDLLVSAAALLIAAEPTQGFALWPGGGAHRDLVATARLLPVPMVVMLVLIMSATVRRSQQAGVLSFAALRAFR